MSFFTIQYAEDNSLFDIIEISPLSPPVSLMNLAKKIIFVVSNNIPLRHLPSTLTLSTMSDLSTPIVCESLLSTALSSSQHTLTSEELTTIQKVLIHLQTLIVTTSSQYFRPIPLDEPTTSANFAPPSVSLGTSFTTLNSPSIPTATSVVEEVTQAPAIDIKNTEEAAERAIASLNSEALSLLDSCLNILTPIQESLPASSTSLVLPALNPSTEVYPTSKLIPGTGTLSNALKRKAITPIEFSDSEDDHFSPKIPATLLSSLELPENLVASDEEEAAERSSENEEKILSPTNVPAISPIIKKKDLSKKSRCLTKASILVSVSPSHPSIYIYFEPFVTIQRPKRRLNNFVIVYQAQYSKALNNLRKSLVQKIKNHIAMANNILCLAKNKNTFSITDTNPTLEIPLLIQTQSELEALTTILQSLLTLKEYFIHQWPNLLNNKSKKEHSTSLKHDLNCVIEKLQNYLKENYDYNKTPPLQIDLLKKVRLQYKEKLIKFPSLSNVTTPLQPLEGLSENIIPHVCYIFVYKEISANIFYFSYQRFYGINYQNLSSNTRSHLKKMLTWTNNLLRKINTNTLPSRIMVYSTYNKNKLLESNQAILTELVMGLQETLLYNTQYLPALLTPSITTELQNTIDLLVNSITPTPSLAIQASIIPKLMAKEKATSFSSVEITSHTSQHPSSSAHSSNINKEDSFLMPRELPEDIVASDEEERDDIDDADLESPHSPTVTLNAIQPNPTNTKLQPRKNTINLAKDSIYSLQLSSKKTLNVFIKPFIQIVYPHPRQQSFTFSYIAKYNRRKNELNRALIGSLKHSLTTTKILLSLAQTKSHFTLHEKDSSKENTSIIEDPNKALNVILEGLLTIKAYFQEAWLTSEEGHCMENELKGVCEEIFTYLKNIPDYTVTTRLHLNTMTQKLHEQLQYLQKFPPVSQKKQVIKPTAITLMPTDYYCYIFVIKELFSNNFFFSYSYHRSKNKTDLCSNARKCIKTTLNQISLILTHFPTTIKFYCNPYNQTATPLTSKKEVLTTILEGLLELKLHSLSHLPDLLNQPLTYQIEELINQLIAIVKPSLPLKTKGTIIPKLMEKNS